MNDEFNQNGVAGEVVTQATMSDKSKLTAALLALFLGWLGAHRFYLGKTGSAIAMLLIFIFSFFTIFIGIGFITAFALGTWSLIDFILILCGKITDAEGRKLR